MSNQTFVLKIIQAIKSLKKLSETDYESDQCLDLLKKIDNSFNDDKSCRGEVAKQMLETNYPEISLKCLKYYTRQNIFENEQTWPCTFYLLRSIWNYTDISSDLACACVGYIPILLDFLSNEYLSPTDEEDEKLFKLTLNILNNIAHQPETKCSFQQNQASKILKKLSTNIENEHLKVLIYLILAQIINEKEFDKLNDPSNEVIEAIANYIKESLKKDKRYKGISTSEYMDCMAKLAVNKDNKLKIYECGLLVIIKAILNNTNSIEDQIKSLNCLWNLCFDEKICDIIKKDKDMICLLNNSKNMSSSEEIQRKSTGILFTLTEMNNSKKIQSANQINHTNKNNKGHIMISYNHASRDICLKIKDELKEKGYPVWIDVEQIYGSSLGSMAEAVENSSVFLMCVSEKYYQSPNCRLEAEYAVRLQKPIIPLIMQPDYMPLGWLGIIIGGKIYYKFSSSSNRQNFDQTLSNMLKEINRYLLDDHHQNGGSACSSSPSSSSSSSSSSSNTSLNKIGNNNNNKPKQQQQQQQVITTANPYNNNIPMINNNNSNNNNGNEIVRIKKSAVDWSPREVKQWMASMNLSSYM